MFDDFDTAECTQVEIVSTLLAGQPSYVEQVVLRLHFAGRQPEEHVVDYAGHGPMWETLRAQIRALNTFLATRD